MPYLFASHFKSSVLVGAVFCTLPVLAQRATNENIPFSRYGIGELQSGTSVALRGAGGTALAASNPFSINVDNPASYGGLKMTTYEAAFQATRRTASFGNLPGYTSGTATLGYLRMGLPIAKNAGLVFGLQPVSRRYYNLRDTTRMAGLGGVLNTHNAEGSLNQALLGAGVEIKGFRVGVNGFYTFGSFQESIGRDYYEVDTARTFGTEILRTNRHGGLGVQVGAQYMAVLKNTLGMRVGATATLSQSLNSHRTELWNAVREGPGGATIRDTAFQTLEESGKTVLPLRYDAGIQLFNGVQWTLSLDYGRTHWGDYKSFEQKDSLASAAHYVAIGGEFTPNNTVSARFPQRITYRLGFKYATEPYSIGGEQPKLVSGTVGLSLPFKRTTDRLHLALELGNRKMNGDYPTSENFARFMLGLSLNDRWFIKRRYD